MATITSTVCDVCGETRPVYKADLHIGGQAWDGDVCGQTCAGVALGNLWADVWLAERQAEAGIE